MRLPLPFLAALVLPPLVSLPVSAQDHPQPPASQQTPGQAQRLDPATQAEISIRRAEPRIDVQAADPQVQIQQSQDKPSIRIERLTRKEASLRDAGVADRQQMVGLAVVGQDGNDVGEVRDLLLTGERIDSVVVEASSGFLGMNERLVAVPWQQVQVEGDDKRLRLPLTDDAIRELPEFQYEQTGPRQALVGPDGAKR
ncbi:PRC-barrel domain-containing protein [Oleisolibacter albus]|uniref:PRC-barrel domain-containing protein n=1 Tax=Oleisolibacter albus TaxID=2171757 RepID=UPI00138FBEB1|nr:PRC-barrel domain-containing protein [Oleisolibacter albus]